MKSWLDWPHVAVTRHSGEQLKRATTPAVDIVIVGCGIAGACLAQALSRIGLSSNIVGPQDSSSANIPALLIRRYAERQASPSHRLYQQAFECAQAFYAQHCPDNWATCVLETPTGREMGGILQTQPALATLLEHSRVQQITAQVEQATALSGGWQLSLSNGHRIQCKQLVLCSAKPPDWLDIHAPITPCAGQVITLDKPLPAAFCGRIHAIPLGPYSQIGSSYRPNDANPECRNDDAHDLLQQAQTEHAALRDARIVRSHAGVRQSSLDHLPLIGPAPDISRWASAQKQHESCRNLAEKPAAPNLPGLWLNLAHGSRGGTMAPLAAKLLTAAIQGYTPPLESDLLNAIHPGRFITKATRRGDL